jgi:hypothetical protein
VWSLGYSGYSKRCEGETRWAGGDAVSTRLEQSAPTAPRIVGTTLRATPSLVEIGLANENDAATGRHATITDVDFSVGLVKQRVRWRSLMVSLAVIHCTLTAGAAGKISAIWSNGAAMPIIGINGKGLRPCLISASSFTIPHRTVIRFWQ